eukprot:scaffold134496_cov50-Attheya_sp.AAC.2
MDSSIQKDVPRTRTPAGLTFVVGAANNGNETADDAPPIQEPKSGKKGGNDKPKRRIVLPGRK